MARDVRPQFDPACDFYVSRPFKAGGRAWLVDELFDKSLAETRRLRQMYDQRMLRQQEPKKQPTPEVTAEGAPVVRRTRYRREAA